MKNNAPTQPTSWTTLPERIRNHLADRAPVHADGTIRIVTAMTPNWPELASLGTGEIALGDDGLIRVALWSASKCCATLLGARRATLLLSEDDGTWEVRCLVIGNASLATPQPLSGFLLKPAEILDGCVSLSVRGFRRAGRTPEDSQNHAVETRLALFDAFPVGDDGETAPPGIANTS